MNKFTLYFFIVSTFLGSVHANPVTQKKENITKEEGVEFDNKNGPSTCKFDRECDIGRVCSIYNFCHEPEFLKRKKCNNDWDCPAATVCPASGYCNDPFRVPDDDVDETKNKMGAHKCHYDKECGTGRRCSKMGFCHKVENPNGTKCNNDQDCPFGNICPSDGICSDPIDVSEDDVDETKYKMGEHKCQYDKECGKGRYCFLAGYCQTRRTLSDF